MSFVRRCVFTIIICGMFGAAVSAAPLSPSTAPAAVTTNTPTKIRITSFIPDEDVLPGSVNVQRLDAAGRAVAVLGTLNDDGVGDDLIAGDMVYTGSVTVTATLVGAYQIRVSAAIRGVIQRAVSPTAVIEALPPGIPTAPVAPDPSKIAMDPFGALIVSDEAITCFTAATTVPRIQEIAEGLGLTIVGRFAGPSNCYQLRLPAGSVPATVHATIDVLSTYPEVHTAQPHGTYAAAQSPVESSLAFQSIRVPHAHGFSGAGRMVAVLDTGVNYDDQRFAPLRLGPNTTTNDPVKQLDVYDFDGHGSHVAGVVRGVAPQSPLLAVKVLDPVGTDTSSEQGIRAAVDLGARIINMSYGGYGFSKPEADAIKYALDAGAVLIAAAGNDNTTTPFYPAAYAGVIAVGALDHSNKRLVIGARGSNFGPWVRIAAPGEDIRTIGVPGESICDGDWCATQSGTSMASAFVAGIAALVRALHPLWSPQEVQNQIEQHAVEYDGWSVLQLGSGRVDALAAVTGMDRIDVEPRDPIIVVGEKVPLHFQVKNTRGEPATLPLGSDVVWKSSDNSIATVDPISGEVTGVSPGTVEISAIERNTEVAVITYCLSQGLSPCPVDPIEGLVPDQPGTRRRVNVTVVEDVSGVYDMVAVGGVPLGSPMMVNDFIITVTGATLRLHDRVLNDRFLRFDGTLHYRQARANEPAVEFEIPLAFKPFVLGPADFYRLAQFMGQPVLSGLARTSFPRDQPTLPPGLILEGLFGDGFGGVFIGPWATLAPDERTLSMGFDLIGPRVLTFTRRAPTRTAGFDPVDLQLEFPEMTQGETSAPLTVTVQNTGTDSLTVDGVRLSGSPSNFAVAGGSCVPKVILSAGQDCTVDVVFKPRLTYRTGVRDEALSITTNAGSAGGEVFDDTLIALTGTATGSPAAAIVPGEVLFLDTFAGQSSDAQLVTVTNTGDLPLKIGVPVLNSGDFFVDVTACSGTTLSPGHSCVMTTRFTPTVVANALLRNGDLAVPTNGGSVSGDEMVVSSVRLVGTAIYRVPIADAGPDRPGISTHTTVGMSAQGSIDPQGHPLTYFWTLLSVPAGSAARLEVADVLFASLTPDLPGQYVVQLVVSNGFAASVPAIVTITAQDAAIPAPVNDPPMRALVPPRIEGVGLLALYGKWIVRFAGGDDDESFWMKIGQDPEFEWEEDETPGRLVTVAFPGIEGLVRFAEEDGADGLRPLTLEALPDGRYLLHLRDDDPPNEIELTLVLESVP